MNRFKFRVWDIYQKCFLSDKNHSINLNGKVERYYCGTYEQELEETGCIVQQFTGLLDKNNKEIYEGDIVKYIYGIKDIRFGAVEWGTYNDGEYVSRIDTFVVKAFQDWPLSDMIHGAGYNYGYAGQIHKNSIEIIGNIFENRELLEH